MPSVAVEHLVENDWLILYDNIGRSVERRVVRSEPRDGALNGLDRDFWFIELDDPIAASRFPPLLSASGYNGDEDCFEVRRGSLFEVSMFGHRVVRVGGR